MRRRRAGRVVNFYSFKGGSGRSVGLANIATILASEGDKVGVIDFDFEAPGIMKVFNVDMPRLSLQDQLAHPRPDRLEDTVVDVCGQSDLDISGGIFLIPASYDRNKTANVPPSIETFHAFKDQILPAFKHQFALDFVLLDSRSGLSEAAAITMTVSEILLVFSRLDRQSVFGTSKIMEFLRGTGRSLYLIASNVTDYAVKMKKREEAAKLFGMPIQFVLPHDERLEFEERLICRDDPTAAISLEYKKIADTLLSIQ